MFLQGSGDVLISYENEAINIERQGKPVEHVNPPQTFKIENPVAVVTTSAHLDKAIALKNFLYTPKARSCGRRPDSGRSTPPSPPSSPPTSRRRRSCGPSPTSVAGVRSIQRCSTRTTAPSPRSTNRPPDDSCCRAPRRPARAHRRRAGAVRGLVRAAATAAHRCAWAWRRSWLSLIVLLPLAAIVWQSAGGGWNAFWSAVTSNAALESFRVTLTISVGVTVINLFFGLLVAWVLDPRRLPRQATGRRGHRPAVRAADDRRQPGDAGALRPEQPGRPPPSAHQVGRRHRAAVRHAAVRRALGAAGAAGARPRGRGGRGVAGRQQPDDLHRR